MCASNSSREDSFTEEAGPVGKNGKGSYKRPKWNSEEPVTREQLNVGAVHCKGDQSHSCTCIELQRTDIH